MKTLYRNTGGHGNLRNLTREFLKAYLVHYIVAIIFTIGTFLILSSSTSEDRKLMICIVSIFWLIFIWIGPFIVLSSHFINDMHKSIQVNEDSNRVEINYFDNKLVINFREISELVKITTRSYHKAFRPYYYLIKTNSGDNIYVSRLLEKNLEAQLRNVKHRTKIVMFPYIKYKIALRRDRTTRLP